jgi:hypothetical protein
MTEAAMAAKKKVKTKKPAKASKAAAPVAAKKKAAPGKKAPASKSGNKTKPTAASVAAFIAGTPNAQRRADADRALAIFADITGEKPAMWGPSIVGYGTYHYRYESGREGDMCRAGFSPRASALVFYLIGGVAENDPLLARLGKHKFGKSCLYVNKLSDIDESVLRALIAKSWAYMAKAYPR